MAEVLKRAPFRMKVRKISGNIVITIPKAICRSMQLEVADELDIVVEKVNGE